MALHGTITGVQRRLLRQVACRLADARIRGLSRRRGRATKIMTRSLDARINRRDAVARRESTGDAPPALGAYVTESRFGTWFIHTGVWSRYVLAVALGSLEGLIPDRRASYPAILDLGCGWGLA